LAELFVFLAHVADHFAGDEFELADASQGIGDMQIGNAGGTNLIKRSGLCGAPERWKSGLSNTGGTLTLDSA
jgi:hypothetical protein